MAEQEGSDYRSMEADQASGKKGGGSGAIIAVVIILIIVAALGYFLLTKKPGGGGAPEMGTSMEILPEKCVMLLQVDTRKMAEKAKREEILSKLKESAAYKEMTEKLQKENNINFEQDIMSWLGEQVVISFFEVPPPPENPGQKPDTSKYNFVVVLDVKDLNAAQAKVKELLAKESSKYKEDKYENVTIWVPSTPNTPTLSFIKGLFVMGNTTDDVKKCIDASLKKGPTLKDNANFKSIVSKLPGDAMGIFYMDMQAVIASGEKMAPMGKTAGTNPEEDKLKKAFTGFGFGLSYKDGDFIGQGLLGINKSSDSAFVKALYETKPTMGAPASLKLFPADTSMYNAVDAKLLYTVLTKYAATMPGGAENLEESKKKIQDNMGVDLDKDIIGNLSGELAYGIDLQQFLQSVMMSRQGQKSPYPMVLSAKVTDKKAFEEVIGKIVAKMPIKLAKEDADGASFYKIPNTGRLGVYNDFFILATGQGDAALTTILENKMDEAKSLATDPGYKKIASKIGPNTFSVSGVKLDKILPMIKMVVGFAAAKDPKQAQQAQDFITEMEKYDSVWSYTEIVDNGFKFEFVVSKKADNAGKTETK
ncbi:MAG: DUF3352 domain-containing protein [Firmicutes bacterium]|nr:DUF3352 domain-containing protein [Bacillota bacterium]